MKDNILDLYVCLHREIGRLPPNERSDARQFFIVNLLRSLIHEDTQEAARASVLSLTLGCAEFQKRVLEKNNHLSSAISTSIQMPVLMPYARNQREALYRELTKAGFGSESTMKPNLKQRRKRPEVEWSRAFTALVIMLEESSVETVHEVTGQPIPILRRLAKLPRFDRTKTILQKWQNALWQYVCQLQQGVECVRRHPDWAHLPKALHEGAGFVVPESVIRQALDRALIQVLNVCRK